MKTVTVAVTAVVVVVTVVTSRQTTLKTIRRRSRIRQRRLRPILNSVLPAHHAHPHRYRLTIKPICKLVWMRRVWQKTIRIRLIQSASVVVVAAVVAVVVRTKAQRSIRRMASKTIKALSTPQAQRCLVRRSPMLNQVLPAQ